MDKSAEQPADASDGTSAPPEQMHCMEVWGGNTAVSKWFEMPGLNSWVYSRPHGTSAGGGDVYFISSCASGRITRVLLADVSGHGEKVSQLAVKLRDVMRDHVNLVRQSKFVQALNRKFTDASDTGKFATALIGTYFSPTRSYEFCNAGHPPPLLYRATQETWQVLESSTQRSRQRAANFPFGIDAASEYEQQSVRLEPGDTILSYSDAFIESRNAEGQLLMTGGLLEIVRSIEMRQPDTFISRLVAAIRAVYPDNLTGDDTTIIMCQASQTRPSLKNNLLAPVRLLRRATDNTSLADTTAAQLSPR